jgi:hypothetical protein
MCTDRRIAMPLGVAALAASLLHTPWAVSADGIETTYAEHTRGVELARAGRHGEALATLLPLLNRFPDDYPLQRDVVLITLWKGDCPEGLRRFEQIRSHPGLEPYLVVPVSDCLLKTNRPREARRLVREALARYPDDDGLGDAFLRADLALRLDENIDEVSPAVAVELEVRESDRNLPEWLAYLEGSARIAERTRLYIRYRATRALDSDYTRGDLDRAGIGVRYRIDERLLFDQEFSGDVSGTDPGGATTRIQYQPRDSWRVALAYASFAEDIPLRARAAGIDARHWSGEAVYAARDYRREAVAAVSRYDFSDSNQRTALYARAGYAYEMRASREQRLFLEGYQSRNSLDGAVYFNPRHDHSIGLLHRTDFIYPSQFRRHVDHLWAGVSAYGQQDYATAGRWLLGYEQDYDFDQDQALAAGAVVARNVYDGRPETEWRLYLHYRRRF